MVGSGIAAERLSGGNGALALLCNTLPTGAILVVLVTILGPVSGAHLNPAVSLVATLGRALPARELPGYALAQVGGGLAGTLLAHAMFELPIIQAGAAARAGPGQWLGELVATAGLVLAIQGCARHRPEAVPWAVGLYITAAYWFTSSTSFANPAVTLARAASGTFAGIRVGDAPAFVAAQVVGAVLAARLGAWLFR